MVHKGVQASRLVRMARKVEYIQTERNRYPEVVALMEEQLKVMYRKTDKEKDVFWKAWRKNVNSIWK